MGIILEMASGQVPFAPTPDVTLDVMKWDDCADECDAYILATLILRGKTTSPKKRAFVAEVVSRLALWDLELVEAMCGVDEATVAAPQEFLRTWACKRGWDTCAELGWESGAVYGMDGNRVLHSAYLAVRDAEALDRRVWSAQAGIYLPWIEERRVQLLPRLQAFVSLPVELDDGKFERLQDLSIGQLAFVLRGAGIDARTRRTIERLREARNLLAHLQPLSAWLALHEDLIG
ncbi:MAG: hypothetical protein U1F48_10120 [Burkholderiales bacterium]|nr:hypothetical protein [Candidatus Hydrogenedentota bacterium]